MLTLHWTLSEMYLIYATFQELNLLLSSCDCGCHYIDGFWITFFIFNICGNSWDGAWDLL